MTEETAQGGRSMKAAVVHEYGGPEVLKYETVPAPAPGDGEVLVRTSAISLNPVDWKMRSGAARERFPIDFPGILGRDVAGTVAEVGAGVTGFKTGDRVFGLVKHAYAEMTVGEAADFALIPEGMDFETAASLPLVMLTGEQLVREGGKVQAGQTVLVTGALGSVGRSAVHAALKTGCRVIAGVRGSQKADVESLRVADVVALDDEADIQRLAPFDVVADTVGGAIAERLTATVKPGGIFASVVALPKDAGSYPHVQFTRIMAHPESATLSRMAAEVQNGEFSIPIGLRLPLAEAARAQAAGEKGGVGKILLIP